MTPTASGTYVYRLGELSGQNILLKAKLLDPKRLAIADVTGYVQPLPRIFEWQRMLPGGHDHRSV